MQDKTVFRSYHEILCIAEKMAEIDVKEVTRFGHHYIVIVTITNTL